MLAFRSDGRWIDEDFFETGSGAIGIEFPESTIVMLYMEKGHPRVHYQPEGER